MPVRKARSNFVSYGMIGQKQSCRGVEGVSTEQGCVLEEKQGPIQEFWGVSPSLSDVLLLLLYFELLGGFRVRFCF